jgi:hypothetical protein
MKWNDSFPLRPSSPDDREENAGEKAYELYRMLRQTMRLAPCTLNRRPLRHAPCAMPLRDNIN